MKHESVNLSYKSMFLLPLILCAAITVCLSCTSTVSWGGNSNVRYHGQVKFKKYHGQGTYIWVGVFKYEGQWEKGKRHGQGTYTEYGNYGPYGSYSEVSKYEGQWQDNYKHGYGTITWSNGDKYIGQWVQGLPNGDGTYILSDGTKYEGQFKNGRLNVDGDGVGINLSFYENNSTRSSRYVGQFKDGKYHGHGTLIRLDGEYFESYRKYVGQFKDGEFLGEKKEANERRDEIARQNLVTLMGALVESLTAGSYDLFNQGDIVAINRTLLRVVDVQTSNNSYNYLVAINDNNAHDRKPFYIITNRNLNVMDFQYYRNTIFEDLELEYIGKGDYSLNGNPRETLVFKLSSMK